MKNRQMIKKNVTKNKEWQKERRIKPVRKIFNNILAKIDTVGQNDNVVFLSWSLIDGKPKLRLTGETKWKAIYLDSSGTESDNYPRIFLLTAPG